ncbi:MAG: hypothetical protein ISR96_03560 [Nitrospira sp.]|nr:hypothetical protein [bacterium]MBL7048592.1 hypothetical protein [Nitrospira sp.]
MGLITHIKLHPVTESLYFLWASPISLFSLVVISMLYTRPSTVAWGYMFNAGTIIIGTVGMLYFFLLSIERPIVIAHLLSESPLPGIILLWVKLPLAHLILNKMKPIEKRVQESKCKEA